MSNHLTLIQLLWLLDEEPVTADLLLHRSVPIVLLLDTSRPPVLGQVTTLLLFLLSNAPVASLLPEVATLMNLLPIRLSLLSTLALLMHPQHLALLDLLPLFHVDLDSTSLAFLPQLLDCLLPHPRPQLNPFLQLRKVTLQTLYPAAKDICNRKHRDLTRLYAQGNALKPKTRY